jgi:hypothetical protein
MSTADRIFDGTAPMPLCQDTSAAGTRRPAVEVEEAQHLVGLPVGVHIHPDGSVEVTLYAEDLTAALAEEGATDAQLAAASAFLDRGTALAATHYRAPIPSPAVCPCGAPARLIITVEVIGSPNLTSRRPACRETCPSIPHQERS